MSSAGLSQELRRALGRLESGDPARVLAELAAEADDPSVSAAVVRKLLAEIAQSKDGNDGRQT